MGSVEELERVVADGWRATEQAALGDWLLRAAGGFTGRANSALAVGDPGLPLPAAVDRVRQPVAVAPPGRLLLPGAITCAWCLVWRLRSE